MVDNQQLAADMLKERPRDPKEILVEMERGVFDAILALSASMEKGMLAGFLVAPSTRGTMVELIFPGKPDAAEGEPNPSKKLEAATPAAVIAMAGEVMHRALILENQSHANHQDYVAVVDANRALRKGVIVQTVGKIITPGVN